MDGVWEKPMGVEAKTYYCGFCDRHVASDRGWQALDRGSPSFVHGTIRICPGCNQPTFFRRHERQVPGVLVGSSVGHLPDDVATLYEEARNAHAAGAFTASVLACRKILMHVAVEKGAAQGLRFIEYVEYLDGEKYLGRDGKGWVDLIRTKSNEANHEITLMTDDDSRRTLTLVEMLLKLVYEFPGSLPEPPKPAPTPAGDPSPIPV